MDPPNTVNGVQVPIFILQERVDELKKLKLYPDDVWIVSYPKSGTTWTQQIVRLIRNNGKKSDKKISEEVPWPEATAGVGKMNIDAFCGAANVEDLPRPRAFKSHFPYNSMPCGPPHTTPCKYIYVARNMKDAIVSWYCYFKGTFFPNIEWDTFWEEMVDGNSLYGNHLDHVLEWWAHKGDENVLFLKYEDMRRDTSKAVSQIASFIGAQLSPDTISKIVDLVSFEKMKADDTTNYSWNTTSDKDTAPIFLRKGVIGDWKNFLTPEQSARMDAICEERLKDTGLQLDFE